MVEAIDTAQELVCETHYKTIRHGREEVVWAERVAKGSVLIRSAKGARDQTWLPLPKFNKFYRRAPEHD